MNHAEGDNTINMIVLDIWASIKVGFELTLFNPKQSIYTFDPLVKLSAYTYWLFINIGKDHFWPTKKYEKIQIYWGAKITYTAGPYGPPGVFVFEKKRLSE